MKLNKQKLHDDLTNHCLKNYKTTKGMFEEIGVNRSVLQSLRKGCDIRSSILIKILNELNKDLKEYLV